MLSVSEAFEANDDLRDKIFGPDIPGTSRVGEVVTAVVGDKDAFWEFRLIKGVSGFGSSNFPGRLSVGRSFNAVVGLSSDLRTWFPPTAFGIFIESDIVPDCDLFFSSEASCLAPCLEEAIVYVNWPLLKCPREMLRQENGGNILFPIFKIHFAATHKIQHSIDLRLNQGVLPNGRVKAKRLGRSLTGKHRFQMEIRNYSWKTLHRLLCMINYTLKRRQEARRFTRRKCRIWEG